MGPKKKKSGGGKKKLSKAEKMRLLREEEERRLLEEEQARIRAELEEAARLERERIEREKTERLEAKDQERRGIELSELSVLEENFLTAAQWKSKYRALAQWNHYTGCDGSPDPTIPQEINTFMSLWKEDPNNDIQLVIAKGNKVLELIEKLEFFIMDTPFHELSVKHVAQYTETIQQLQSLLHDKYNAATEQMLREASSYAESESGNMEVVIKEQNVTLCIWANLKKVPKFRSQIFHDDQREPWNGFELPKSLAICDVAVRILHTHYDHLSPFRTFPTEPPKLEMPPIKTVKSSALHNSSSLEVKSTSEEEGSMDKVFDKSASILKSVSRVHISSLRIIGISESQPLEEHVVDLNQFIPVGGVYHFDALKLPPQAKLVKGWTMVEVLDTGLEMYPYEATCDENEDPSSVTVGLTVRLLDSVIYFEEPLIARWDSKAKYWRTDDIGDVVYNMQEKEIGFKMNGFFTVTLMQDAHLNMPYQSWELRPNGPDEAFLTILTTFAEVQIQIKLNQCMLAGITTMEDTTLLSELRGVWMSPLALTIALKRAGMNIFPAEYSPKYVSINKKTLLAEITSYQQMALIASSFAFSWSKWNLLSGEENVVFKICEHLKQEPVWEEKWLLVMFNGQRAQRLQLTEESNHFSKNIAEDTEFHSTLYHLIKDLGSEEAMERIKEAHHLFIDAVYQLLLSTKILTYS
ncbi:dynein axonemal intermediate chain 7 isoform X4 [Zootoca vivipara]|uniref:dynein axonemal intermediate chain 7 isoform X4 n=1 Tax=Zootoca vivipara TaxID=8524 RepID=UPI00293BBC38|nr:dynein axonemal intermediate chain 7 isoform X4 [Zootoca vivipara]